MLVFVFSNVEAQSTNFSHLGVDMGLSQGSVYAIFQDSKGFMWFGTGDGLNRYDGWQMKVYRHANIDKPLGNFFTDKIVEDVNGNLWVGTRCGLTFYNYKQDRLEKIILKNNEKILEGWIEVLGTDSKNNVWFWDRNSNIFKYNPATREYKIIRVNEGESIFRQGYFDRAGYLWYNTTVGLCRLNIETEKRKIFMRDRIVSRSLMRVSTIYKDNEGLMWIAGVNDMACFNSLKEQEETVPEEFSESNIICSYKDKLWLGSQKSGLLCYNKSDKTIKYYKHDKSNINSLASDIVSAMFIDRSENLWVATDGFGLNIADLKPQKFPLYQNDAIAGLNFSDNFIKSFYEDAKGRLWIGSNAGGINILDRKKGQVATINAKNSINAFIRDNYNNLIIATNKTVELMNENALRSSVITIVEAGPEKKPISVTYGFCKTREGMLLQANSNGLYIAVYKDNKPVMFKLIKSTKGLVAGSVFQTSDGRIWVSEFQGGYLNIMKFENDEFKLLSKPLQGLNIGSFYEDTAASILWMGSESGLVKYDLKNGNTTFINEKNGLANSHIYGLLCDTKGNLWLSTNKGISCYDPLKNTFRNYDINDGLQSNEFNTNSFYKSPSGEFFFGGINGFNAFYPEKVMDNIHKPLVALCHIMVNDEETDRFGNPACLGNMKLNYSENTLSFDFSALEFTKHEKNNYEYRLIGTDKEWVSSGNKHFARYSNLRPGQYQFVVRASNNDGLWSDEKLLCSFFIRTPWWQTWWAMGLLIIGVLLLIIWLVRLSTERKLKEQRIQIEKQKALEEERNRISKDMHDDLGSGLSKIAIMSELLKTSIKDKNDEESVAKISRTANELVDSMSQIIWAMNPENDNIENILGYLRKFSLDFFEDSPIKCELSFPDVPGIIVLPQTVKRNLFLVIKESFHNILKHSRATEVKVQVEIEKGLLRVIIKDNGTGFDININKHSGNGLNNMRKRMQTVSGSFIVSSEVGEGTQTLLEIEAFK